MGATSHTGVGKGDSNGKQKPDNHCGCACGKPDETVPEPKVKRGCVTRWVGGGKVSIKVGSSSKLKVC